jgi:hypothetical protein
MSQNGREMRNDMTYIVLAHSALTGNVFSTRITGCTYKDVRERFYEIYNDSYKIISITEVIRYK